MEGRFVESALAAVRKKKPGTKPKTSLVTLFEKQSPGNDLRKASDSKVSYARKSSKKGKRPEWNSSTIRQEYKLTPAEIEERKKQRISKNLGVAVQQLYAKKKLLLPLFNKYDCKEMVERAKSAKFRDDPNYASYERCLESSENQNFKIISKEYKKRMDLGDSSCQLVVPNNSVTNILALMDTPAPPSTLRFNTGYNYFDTGYYSSFPDPLESFSTTVFPSLSYYRPVSSRQDSQGNIINYVKESFEEEKEECAPEPVIPKESKAEKARNKMKEKVWPPPWQNIYK